MGNSPPGGKRSLGFEGYPNSYAGQDELFHPHVKQRSFSTRRGFSFGRSHEVSSCQEAMENDIADVSSHFARKASIRDIFRPHKRPKQRSRSSSCNLVFPMDEKSSKNVNDDDDTMSIDSQNTYEPQQVLVPTVFKWKGGGNEISISGTFNNWRDTIPLAKKTSSACIILNLPPGEHEYKFFIDGAWYHDPTKPSKTNRFNTKNNVVVVKPEDSDVLAALDDDILNSKHQPQDDVSNQAALMGQSPPGEYGTMIPPNPEFVTQPFDLSPTSTSYGTSPNKIIRPPILPPLLAQGLLNRDINPQCDPNLLPSPNHVIVNHLYALSIKNGVIVLSVIRRYRQKYVSTLFYKPIKG